MSQPFICRPCLQRIQQHGRHSFNAGKVQVLVQSRRESTLASQSTGQTPFIIRKVKPKHLGPDPAIELIRNRRNSYLRQSVKRIEAEGTAASKDKSSWAQELAQEKTSRYQEYGYLRHSYSKTELKRFTDWKNDLIRLIEYTSQGASYKVPARLDWILDRQAVEVAIGEWDSWATQKKSSSWHSLMFSALWSCPDRALAVLEATTQDFTPPGYAIKDAIHFLAKWQRVLSGNVLATHAKSLRDFAIAIINTTPHNHVRLRQNTIYSLTNDPGMANIDVLYHCLRENGHKIHRHTLLHMASRLSKAPQHKELALQMTIEAIEEGGADLNSRQWSSLCTSILALDPQSIKTSDEFSAADAFGLLLEHGFVPNMVNYTAVIRSLCLTGQSGTAWEVFQVMRRHDIEPDTIMWSTLLDGAKRALSASTVERVVDGAIEYNAIDVPFLNDLLFSVLHFSEAETRDNKRAGPGSVPAFGPMLHFYSKIFHLAPLQALVPVDFSRYLDASRGLEMPADWQLPRQLFPALDTAMSAVPDKLSPTGATLGIMFIAYVKSLTQPISLISLYAYFRQLISNGSPVATNFVQEKGTFVYDVIIKALCESPGMLRAALDIIGDMLKHTLEERSKSDSAARHPLDEAVAVPSPLHPAPSVFTWSILLHGFMFHKEKGSGERILAMMRQHGIEPNLVTWNTLVAGHARNQDVNKTVHSLQRLEAAGHEADDYTLRAFSKLVNREAALRKMEKTIDDRKKNEEAQPIATLDADIGLQL